MSAFAARVAALTGLAETRMERLAGGDLSPVLLVRRDDGHRSVAKGGPRVAAEAAMLRALAAAGVPTPAVEGEYDGVLLLSYVENDALFSARAWASIGETIRSLHAHHGTRFGWPVDYAFGTVDLHNQESDHWPVFWAERRLIPTASLLDRPWRERVAVLAQRLPDLLPDAPPPSLLHGDLWSGNVLVQDGRLAALIDPACAYGHAEVDLAMLCLFDQPPVAFWEAYGGTEPGWTERRAIYQLFPALVHLRLFGASYGRMVDRLLASLGA